MITNYLTIDVEEHFQVSAFDGIIAPADWEKHGSRVEKNTRRLLDLLDRYRVRATFFVVGWTAERHPGLVREIVDRGHDIGCHSYLHRRIYELTPHQFTEDTIRAKTILEEITDRPVVGYRAPSYSITSRSLWALDILKDLGFSYDSSIFPIHHDLYGIPDAPRFRYRIEGDGIIEYPMSTCRLLGKNIPVSGGGYFRLLPFRLTKMLLARINEQEQRPFLFYLHPWEIDPEQPRILNAGLLSRFRHYNNLARTESRLQRLLESFHFMPIPLPTGSAA